MQENCTFVNGPLPYPYEAMEPYIDIQTMYLHHDKHLQAYIDKLNELVSKCMELQALAFADKGRCGFAVLAKILKNLASLPPVYQTPVKDNAGGVFNHWFYFNGLAGKTPGKPQGRLAESIRWQFGGFEGFRKEFTEAALGVFGSGYAWLVTDLEGNLEIIQTADQDTPVGLNLAPVLCVDVWEHAYYLKHKNLRKNYLQDWFAVANWEWAQWSYGNPAAFLG